MPLTDGVQKRVLQIIEEMKRTAAEEAPIPRTPLTVVKTVRADELPVQRFGEYAVVQRGI